MTTAVARPTAVRRKVQLWLAEQDSCDVIALRARPHWEDDPVLTVEEARVRVVPCPTPLAARAALRERASGEKLVLLTDQPEDKLGDSVLAHLSRQTVRSIDRWDLVSQVFGATRLDPALVQTGRWVADALIDHAPLEGWPAPPGEVITREHALRHLVSQLLELDQNEIDLAGLLQWTTRPSQLLRFTALPEPVVAGISAAVVEFAGPGAEPVMAAVQADQGADVIPLGLLIGGLWARNRAQADPEVLVARARLEPRFGGLRFTERQAHPYRDAAEAWIDRALSDRDGEPLARQLLDRAEEIAATVPPMPHLLRSSPFLPSGLAGRISAFAQAVRSAVPTGPVADRALVVKAQDALAELVAHRTVDPHRVATAQMAVRLLRWLSTDDGPAPATLYEAVHRHVQQDGWVDRARLDVFAGDPGADQGLAEAYRRLHQAVMARRARHDQQFATRLAEATSAEADPGALLRVEDVLERVVRPILDAGQRVLLLVLDGMGMAAATELAESVGRTWPWLELTPDGGARTGVLAALPTVTEVSRCSLLSGRIAAGGQAEEQAAFQQRFPGAVLLHKRHLRTGAGAAVDEEVRAALADPRTSLVAAVINTIDDELDRSTPGTAVWDLHSLGDVRHLLALASDRVVVVVSDHGHVVDYGTDATTGRSPLADNRWRPATEPAMDGEVLVSGSRVLVPPSRQSELGSAVDTDRAVLAWREELRYGPRKAGYHGGAAPAEVVIPLLVFSRGQEEAVPGWRGAPAAGPEWWREPVRDEPAPSPQAPRVSTRRGTPRQPELGPALFEVPEAPVVPQPTPSTSDRPPGLVAALLASEVYRQRRGSRAPLPDDRVAALLEALLAGGGRATMDTLSARAGIPAHRITGTVTALRRLLQVEGYPVIEIDPDGRTVKLNEPLLREQFMLGGM